MPPDQSHYRPQRKNEQRNNCRAVFQKENNLRNQEVLVFYPWTRLIQKQADSSTEKAAFQRREGFTQITGSTFELLELERKKYLLLLERQQSPSSATSAGVVL